MASKSELAGLLSDITRIPVDVLRMQQNLSTVSVAHRMSWAAGRKTTRIEDEAYCLMGIFGVTMPVYYGEGKEAFRRLQEEIIKRNVDTTIFAWGIAPFDQEDIASIALPSTPCSIHDEDSRYLLASSPSSFAGCHLISCNTPRGTSPEVRGIITSF